MSGGGSWWAVLFIVVSFVPQNDDTAPAPLSPGTLSGRPCDPYAFRRLYPHKWRDFLRAHFGSATEVETFFSIEETTARNWWHGKTGPQGWAVDFAREAIAAEVRT